MLLTDKETSPVALTSRVKTASPPSQAAKPSSGPQRCWECVKRRLVCDLTKPACKKCATNGVTCPGYGAKKPLTWLAPGKVKSKTRKKKAPQDSPEAQQTSSDDGNERTLVRKKPSRRSDITIPHVPFSMRHDFATDVVSAVQFYNATVVPCHASTEVWTMSLEIPVASFTILPTSAMHAFVSMIHGIKILRSPHTERNSRCLASDAWEPVHYHRMKAIKALNEELADEGKRLDDNILHSIAMLQDLELNESVNSDWKAHYKGMCAFLEARGGAMRIISQNQAFRDLLHGQLVLEHVSNSTSPPLDQMRGLPGLDDLKGFTSIVETGTYGTFPCPTELWIELLRINDLRARQAQTKLREATSIYGGVVDDTLASQCLAEKLESAALLLRIIEFDPEAWAQGQDRYYLLDIWLTIGKVFRKSLLLFAATSLYLPNARDGAAHGYDLETRQRASYEVANAAKFLAQHIEESLQESAPFGGILFWPLIVLGVYSASCPEEYQDVVRRGLVEISSVHGIIQPLLCKEALERFWASGQKDWNDCFDKPYAFVL